MIRVLLILGLLTGASYAIEGRDCSRQNCSFDIGTFSNEVKTNLGNAQDVKERLKSDVGYDPDKAAQDPTSVPDRNAAGNIEELLQSLQGASSISFTCTEKRVITLKTLYRCTWNENLFPSLTLCEENCVEEGVCSRAACYGTAYCNKLTGGFVCPLNIRKCNATPVCPPGGSYNAQTGKCEANPVS